MHNYIVGSGNWNYSICFSLCMLSVITASEHRRCSVVVLWDQKDEAACGLVAG